MKYDLHSEQEKTQRHHREGLNNVPFQVYNFDSQRALSAVLEILVDPRMLLQLVKRII